VFFASYRDGRSTIQRMDRDGHHARPLADVAIPSNLAATPDGRSLLFTALHKGDRGTFIMPAEGGTPTLVAERLERAAPSPDGKYVAGLWRATVLDAFELAVMPLHGGTPVHRFPSTDTVVFTNSGVGNLAWAPDGRSVYVTTAERTDIWRQRLDGAPLERVTNFLDGGIFGFTLSPDGRSLIVSRGPNLRDAFLITGFQ
jgi:Tol biopolymer transport system component